MNIRFDQTMNYECYCNQRKWNVYKANVNWFHNSQNLPIVASPCGYRNIWQRCQILSLSQWNDYHVNVKWNQTGLSSVATFSLDYLLKNIGVPFALYFHEISAIFPPFRHYANRVQPYDNGTVLFCYFSRVNIFLRVDGTFASHWPRKSDWQRDALAMQIGGCVIQ